MPRRAVSPRSTVTVRWGVPRAWIWAGFAGGVTTAALAAALITNGDDAPEPATISALPAEVWPEDLEHLITEYLEANGYVLEEDAVVPRPAPPANRVGPTVPDQPGAPPPRPVPAVPPEQQAAAPAPRPEEPKLPTREVVDRPPGRDQDADAAEPMDKTAPTVHMPRREREPVAAKPAVPVRVEIEATQSVRSQPKPAGKQEEQASPPRTAKPSRDTTQRAHPSADRQPRKPVTQPVSRPTEQRSQQADRAEHRNRAGSNKHGRHARDTRDMRINRPAKDSGRAHRRPCVDQVSPLPAAPGKTTRRDTPDSPVSVSGHAAKSRVAAGRPAGKTQKRQTG